MTDRIEKRLEDEIIGEIESLGDLDPGSEDYKAVVDGIAKLCKAQTEMENAKAENNTQRAKTILDRVRLCVDAAGIVLPLIFYANWMRKGLKFEETGTFTSTTFKNLIGKFRPEK